MRRLIFTLLLLSAPALAQKTTVTALVVDANGTVYQNCRYSVTFVGQSSLPGPYLVSGSVFQTDFPGSNCDSSGNLSIQLYANSLISPTPSQWRFDVCDQTGKFCGVLLATIAGGSQNISAGLTAILPLLPAGGGIAGFYQTVRQNGTPQTQRPALNLVSGSNEAITCVDNVGALSTDCTFALAFANVPAFSALTNLTGAPATPVFATVQGTDTKLLTAGTMGSTGNALCQDTNGGASTAGCVSAANVVITNPTVSQNVVQPSAGGLVTPGTSLNANVFEQIRYADDFQRQFPLSPSGTISIGANTITINAVRGISTYSCVSPGTGCAGNFGGTGTTQYLYIAGTGTPEAVKITGTSCIGASTGTCTITFTAANSHSAGFTVSSATGGFAEALVDAYSLATGNPTTGREIACSPYPTNSHYIFYATLFVDGFASSFPGRTFFEGHGCVLEDAVAGGPMIKVTANAYATIEHFTLATRAGVGRAANGTQVFVYDQGQLFHFAYNGFACPSSGCSTDVVDRVIEVNADQGATIDHNDFEGIPMKCDATWCGAIIYGDAVSNAAIGDVHDNYFSTNQDPLLWDSGNGLSLKDNVFQNWVHYPFKYRGGLLALSNQGGNYYEGNCSLVNPDFGVAGYSCNTGPQVETSGSQPEYKPSQDRNVAGSAHRFTSTGANIYTYYIVGHLGAARTRPLFIGDASTDGVTNFTVLYLKFGADTYDVLRSGPYLNNGTDTAPYGTGNWAVATGIVCAANPCSYTETFAAASAYTVSTETVTASYTPNIDYWPVPLYIHGSSSSPSTYNGPAISFVNGSTGYGSTGYYDGIFSSETGGAGNLTGMHVLRQAPLVGGGTSNSPGAMILNPDIQNNNFNGFKGRINMPSYSVSNNQYTLNHDNLLYQTFDPDSSKTLATPDHQPPLNAAGTDCGMGYDTNASYLMFMCGNPISFYVAHKPDSGVSAVGQFATTGLNFKSNTNPCWSNATANFTTLDLCGFRVDKGIVGFNTGSGTTANAYESDAGLKQTTVANATTTSTANPPTVALYTYILPATTTARNYSWECSLVYQSSVNTAGLILGVNSSVNPASMLHHARIFTTKTGTATDDSITTTTLGATLTLAGANVTTGATNYEAILSGTIEEPATGGTLALPTYSATSAATITMLRGNFCRVWVN